VKIIKTFEAAEAEMERRQLNWGDPATEKAVKNIIATVAKNGDRAVHKFTREIDKVSVDSLEVERDEIAAAYDKVDIGLIEALGVAAEQVRLFHQRQMQYSLKEFMGAGLGQIVRPIQRAGIYVPGGTAAYPSTVLMTAIPARVAGVEQIVMVTPPGRDGKIPLVTLVAAEIAGVDRIFRAGGAQAIAALAYGTESIPRVDKICGPGGLYVTIAKRLVYGVVGIDGLYGPTETVVLADDSASPECCAADLLAQAEHDPLSAAILITTSSKLARQVNKEVERRLNGLERADIARRSLEDNGCIIIIDDMEHAVDLVNLYAPEHLELMVRDASFLIEDIRNAGGIFIGKYSAEVLGDYVAGPSHVMPTGGSARFSSPLGVNDFLKLTSVIALGEEDLELLGPVAAALARLEGLTAHAMSATIRLKKGSKR